MTINIPKILLAIAVIAIISGFITADKVKYPNLEKFAKLEILIGALFVGFYYGVVMTKKHYKI